MSFSDRYGYTSDELPFQKEVVDDSLRIALWNILKICIWDNYHPYIEYGPEAKFTHDIDVLVQRIWFFFFNNDMDALPKYKQGSNSSYDYLKNYFMTCEWYGVYNLLEYIANDNLNTLSVDNRDWINGTLERYNSAYRFVDKQIVEITSDEEIHAIEEALVVTQGRPAKDHIRTALQMLSDRGDWDYRNSVKESISAVESTVRDITNNQSATLGTALKEVASCHPALSQAFQKIYGYTNDESGIRHSLTDQAETTYAEAKFMLVACSAFISYLIDSIEKA